jgi:hypothetical protein
MELARIFDKWKGRAPAIPTRCGITLTMRCRCAPAAISAMGMLRQSAPSPDPAVIA